MYAPQLTRAYVLKRNFNHEDLSPFDPDPPSVILEFENFTLAIAGSDEGEFEFYTSTHALQLAYIITGGSFDEMYEESEEAAYHWRRREVTELLDDAVNCTPGFEGQSISV